MPSYKCYDWDIVRTGSAAASAAARANGGVDGWNRQTVNRGSLYRRIGSGGAGSDCGDGPDPVPDDPEFQFWAAALPVGFLALFDQPQSRAPKRGQRSRQEQGKGRHPAGRDRERVHAAAPAADIRAAAGYRIP